MNPRDLPPQRPVRDPRGDQRSAKRLARALAAEKFNGNQPLSGRQWKKLKRALRRVRAEGESHG